MKIVQNPDKILYSVWVFQGDGTNLNIILNNYSPMQWFISDEYIFGAMQHYEW